MPKTPSAIAAITSSTKTKTAIRSSAQPSRSAAGQPALAATVQLTLDPVVLKSGRQTHLKTGTRPEALSERNQLRPGTHVTLVPHDQLIRKSVGYRARGSTRRSVERSRVLGERWLCRG